MVTILTVPLLALFGGPAAAPGSPPDPPPIAASAPRPAWAERIAQSSGDPVRDLLARRHAALERALAALDQLAGIGAVADADRHAADHLRLLQDLAAVRDEALTDPADRVAALADVLARAEAVEAAVGRRVKDGLARPDALPRAEADRLEIAVRVEKAKAAAPGPSAAAVPLAIAPAVRAAACAPVPSARGVFGRGRWRR